jgi:hypothetical protein
LGGWASEETNWKDTWDPNTNTLTATANTIFIWEEGDAVDFGNLISRQTQADQFVREIKEIKEAIADALALLKNGDCNKFLSSDKHKARDLLKDLDKLDRINRDYSLDDPRTFKDKYGREYQGMLIAEARGVGIGTKEENIGIGKLFFGGPPANSDSGGGAYERLTARGFRALNLLHELGHKTGRYVHDEPKPNYKEIIDTPSLNSGVFFNCFAQIKNKKLNAALLK